MSRLLVFDSGVGGLSVVREIIVAMPAAEIVYVADDAGFPYGEWEDAALTDRVVAVVAELIGRFSPDTAVIACNTASTLVLPPLRALFALPFVGTVPAIKPAAEHTRSGLVSVLATYGTMRRDYTRGLIESFAQSCFVRLVGSGNLALLAEAHMRGEPIDETAIASEIAPAFVSQDGKRTDTIVLACTHYPFLLDFLVRLAPWPVEWIDPAAAIARRTLAVTSIVLDRDYAPGAARGVAYLTSGKAWTPPLAELLATMGLMTGTMPPILPRVPEVAGQSAPR